MHELAAPLLYVIKCDCDTYTALRASLASDPATSGSLADLDNNVPRALLDEAWVEQLPGDLVIHRRGLLLHEQVANLIAQNLNTPLWPGPKDLIPTVLIMNCISPVSWLCSPSEKFLSDSLMTGDRMELSK